jgi:hypothetical protein
MLEAFGARRSGAAWIIGFSTIVALTNACSDSGDQSSSMNQGTAGTPGPSPVAGEMRQPMAGMSPA